MPTERIYYMFWLHLVGGGSISGFLGSPHAELANGLPGTPPSGPCHTQGRGPAGRVSPSKWVHFKSSWFHMPTQSGSLLLNRVGTPYSLSFPHWCTDQPDQTAPSGRQIPSVANVLELTPGLFCRQMNTPPSIGCTVQNHLFWDVLYPLLLPPWWCSGIGPRLTPHWRSWGREVPPWSRRDGPWKGPQNIRQTLQP